MSSCRAENGQGPQGEAGVDKAPPAQEDLEMKDAHGRFVGGDQGLTADQRSLILAYLETYYQTLAVLEVGDVSDLFSSRDRIFAPLHQEVWDYMVKIRRMQAMDLRMDDYRYDIRVDGVEKLDPEDPGGGIRVSLTVDSFVTFAAYSDIEAEEYGTIHYFDLVEEADGWRIQMHMQRGTLYWTMLGDYYRDQWLAETLDISDGSAVADFKVEKDRLLAMAKENMEGRTSQGQPIVDLSPSGVYDRQKALAYADRWIVDRNDDWFDYGNHGGNCQNFASQCLIAGGIPMDLEGDQWKWYDNEVSEMSTAQGRSPSWAGVDEFLAYARINRGVGLVATVDAPYDQGEIGDLLVLGYGEDWRHTVIITHVVKEEAGKPVDYLIASNTANQRNYPVSAYMYTAQILVKIHGWQE
jgi:hypothetical protein